MAQLSPSTTYYAQALALISDFQDSYAEGRYSSVNDVAEKLKEVISRFNYRAGKPLTQYEPFTKGEPPISAKFNKFLQNVQMDINIMQQQLTLLRASATFMHNYISTEILKASRENAQANNKLKTLQLYSTAHDDSVIIFGDHFRNTDFIDNTLIPLTDQTSLIGPGHLTLGRELDTENLASKSTIKILATSNGFLGNNQELEDPSLAPINPSTSERDLRFKAETNRHAEIKDVVDGEPNTWIEYEAYRVKEVDRDVAKGFNFSYQNDSANNDVYETEATDAILNTDNSLLDWSRGPRDGSNTLHLDLEFNLGELKTINTITYTPFGLADNVNHPVKVSVIQTSPDGTDWVPVEPQNLWIGTDANLNTARAADEVMIGGAMWSFDERPVRYIRIKIEQTRPIIADIGHLYYETQRRVVVSTTEEVDNTQPTGVSITTTETVVGGEREEGPIPPLSRPDKYYGDDRVIRGNLVQKTEAFEGERWVIGIRDILFEKVKYKEKSVMVSKPFRINGIVDRVALESDIYVPESFPADDLWVRFYVSPDDGLNWFPISRIQDDFFGIPEILAFNDPLPKDFHEVGVAYHTVNSTVDRLRLKIEITRPDGFESSSPIIKNYRLKVRKR